MFRLFLFRLIAAGLIFSVSTVTFAQLVPPNPETLPKPHTVALTFDDGPSPIYTPQVLAILKKYNIKKL